MLNIEQYIRKRKYDGEVNEFILSDKEQHINFFKQCIDDYFNEYLNSYNINQNELDNIRKSEKYKKKVRAYNQDIIDWASDTYDKHGIYIDVHIVNLIKKEQLFLLFFQEDELLDIAKNIHRTLSERYVFLNNDLQIIFDFVKNYHKINSKDSIEDIDLIFSNEINQWIKDTYQNYGVNLLSFAYHWANYFFEHPQIWPINHKVKSNSNFATYEYDYKNLDNVFNINNLYLKVSERPFMCNHKKDLETLIMYYWLHDISGEEEYWTEYHKILN
ncbi:hypothetical protein [Macrococcus brunensis]|uniref:hypothetical protein n=1 Tax=Macrococcus brunensis TaxID=198483 RepID=UPI001EF13DBC|nr:hypothetical protein [Macrococcus brunensis]ULG72400.1 hypothetical protein MGG12_02450 [Macrococcus brunensis]